MSPASTLFADCGPFDPSEREVIVDVLHAMEACEGPGAADLVARVREAIISLDRFGGVLCDYPSLFAEQSLGSRRRDLTTLVDALSRADLSNFDMFLPTRALVARTLVMGEVNFYRRLRFAAGEVLNPGQVAQLRPRVDRLLVECLYTRLAELVLIHIASDSKVTRDVREKAVLSLTHIWERVTYRIGDFFPVLHATWNARRRVRVTAGTLLGTAEMFALMSEGCDESFVDYLARPEHTDGEAAAFREFLFGATTEQLERMQQHMHECGQSVMAREEMASFGRSSGSNMMEGDPAIAMFEFFLSRHLQAAARRQADLPGPKRTAEEYVLLHFLQDLAPTEKRRLSVPPPRQ
jgi:hypothetical protein